MSQLLICPQGHEWIGETESSTCPQCGAAADLTEGTDLDSVADDLPPAPAGGVGGVDQTLRRPFAFSPLPMPRAVEPGPLPSLPGFEIVRVLGRGGMGVVYQARQLSLDRPVALKMILTAEYADPEERQRFRAEADAVARLQHPHIVSIHEIGEHEGRAYIALEYIGGGSLADRLDGTPWPADASARLIATLARAIDYAHSQHIVHRDLKPANILLMKSSTDFTDSTDSKSGALASESVESVQSVDLAALKITDFGLAKRMDRPAGATHTGAILGTPSYMAPEQAVGGSKHVGPACDIYALGAILYELLTGRPPFKGPTATETLQQVINAEPVAPQRLQPRIPRDVETICLKCLHKEPQRRYLRAADLADDLERFLTGQPIHARPVSWSERTWKWARRRPALAALAGVTLLAAAALATILVLYSGWLADENQRYLDERNTARQAADEARRQEKKAQDAAGEARRQQKRALAGLRMSMQAVDQFLKRVGETRTLFAPHLEPDRAQVFEDALAFCRKFLDDNKGDADVREQVGLTLARTALILRHLRRDAESEKAFLDAIAFWETYAGGADHAAFTAHLAEAHYQRGHLHRWTRPPIARAAYEKTRALVEPLVQTDPHNETAAVLYGWCLHDLAILEQEAGRPAEAETLYRAALAVRDEVRKTYPKNPSYRLYHAHTQANLGLLAEERSRLDDAEKHLADTLDDLRALLKDYPIQDYPKSADYASDLGTALINMGNVYSRTERLDKAEAVYQEARRLFTRLHEYQPGVPGYQERLALALHNLGDLASDRKQHAAAEEYLTRSTELNDDLAKRYPHYHPPRRALAGNHLSFADVYWATKRRDRAYDKAVAATVVLDKLIAEDPNTLADSIRLGKACILLTIVKAERKEFADALEMVDKALGGFNRALARDPKHAEAAQLRRHAEGLRQKLLPLVPPTKKSAALDRRHGLLLAALEGRSTEAQQIQFLQLPFEVAWSRRF